MNKDKAEIILGKKKEVKRIQPLLKIRSPISSSIKRSKDSKLITNGLENLESLNLYSLKLGLVRDLISLSAKYQSTNSIQARFSKILNISQSLNSLLQISEERIRTDTKFRDTLTESLDSLESVQVEKIKKNEQALIEDDSYKICANVSGVCCIAFITHNRNFSQFDIDVYGENDNCFQSYHLNQVIKAQKSDFESVLVSRILDHVYFSLHQDRIVLRFKEKFDNEEVLVANVQGIDKQTCVVLREVGEGYEACVGNRKVELPKSDICIGSIEELRDPRKRTMVRKILEQNLSLVRNELSWKLSQWEIARSINKKTCTGLFKKEFVDKKDCLEPFETVLVSGSVFLKESTVNVSLIFDTFLQKNRVMLYLGESSVKIKEENYEKDFKFMKKMQKVEFCSVTMLRSLEFLLFIDAIFFN